MACWKEKLNLPEDQHFTGLRRTDIDAKHKSQKIFAKLKFIQYFYNIYNIFLYRSIYPINIRTFFQYTN